MKNKKKKTIIIIAVILAVIIAFGGVGSAFRHKMKSDAESIQQENAQTDVISVRSLSQSVGATGTVVSLDNRNITLSLSDSEIKSINVSVGDTVKKGDVLAVLDVSDAEESLTSAKKALSNTEERNKQSISDAERQLKNAEKSRDNAKADYETIKDNYDNNVSTLDTLKKSGQSAVEIAKQEEIVKNLETQLKQAETQYDTAKNSVETAKSSLKTVKLSADTSQQEAQIKQYQKQVDSGTVTAPFDGTITSVNYKVGEKYSLNSVLMTIQDCSAYEIKADISEYDISSISLGQTVIIKTDATGDLEMSGKIIEISPTANSSSGSSSFSSTSAGNTASTGMSTGTALSSSNAAYAVKISIDNPSDKLRLDMTANISVIIQEHNNAFTVPYNAVYTDDNGQNYIKIISNGETQNINVEVVMESNYYTEIKGDGLTEGMKVSLQDTNSDDQPAQISGPPFMQRGGGF